MKMNNRRRFCSIIAFTAALSMLASGCEKMNEDLNGIPEMSVSTLTVTEASTETTPIVVTEATDTTVETTAPVTEETTETTTVTEEKEESDQTTAPDTDEGSDETSSAASADAEEKEWSETGMSATMYVSENCYSRERAIVGSVPISQHYVGDKVEIVAITDTGYYKLAEGGYIHSDYISDIKPVVTTAATTTAAPKEEEKPETTKKTEAENDGGNGDTGSGSSGSGTSQKPTSMGNIGGVITPSGYYKTSYTSRYSYNQLSKSEQELYQRLVKAAYNLDNVVEVPEGLSSDDVMKVYNVVYTSEPEIFWLSTSITPGSSFVYPKYLTTDVDEIKSMQSKMEKAAQKILDKAANYNGTVSKLKVFYDTIIYQAEFESGEGGFTGHAYNGLTGGSIQCVGYAKTMQYLCDMAGIESMVVIGKSGAGVSHAWNVVYCENGYYNLDTTWGDPLNNFGSDYVEYEFFLVPDAWIHNITHFSVNIFERSNGSNIKLFDPPACTKESCNYFNAYNKLYDNYEDADAALREEFKKQIAAGKNVVEIRVTSKDIYDKMTSKDTAIAYQKYAKSLGNVDHIARQLTTTAGSLIVHYNVTYS